MVQVQSRPQGFGPILLAFRSCLLLAAAVESRKLFPAWESLVGDIPAGDRKNRYPFLQCR